MFYKTLKLLPQDLGSNNVEKVYYKSKVLDLRLEEGLHSKHIQELNPHLVGKTTKYLVLQFKNINKEKFQVIITDLERYLVKKLHYKTLQVNEGSFKASISMSSSNYHLVMHYLDQSKICRYFYKTYSVNDKIPNNGSPAYINAPLYYLPYNVYQLFKVWFKRSVLCFNHKFSNDYYCEYCTKCGIKKMDNKKLDWYSE